MLRGAFRQLSAGCRARSLSVASGAQATVRAGSSDSEGDAEECQATPQRDRRHGRELREALAHSPAREDAAEGGENQQFDETASRWHEQSEASTSGPPASLAKWLPPELQRTLRIAIIGAPNAGKSTLTNLLVGTQVTAVSQKTNTTRRETLGAVTLGDTQLVIVDTPGVVSAASMRAGGQAARVTGAWRAAASADLLLFLVDAHRQATSPDPRVADLAASLGPELQKACYTEVSGVQPPPVALVQNKIDLLPKPRGPLVSNIGYELGRLHPFVGTFAISAEHEHGVEELIDFLRSNAEERPWELPPDCSFAGSPAALALEIVREAIFERLHQELPYKISIRHVGWRDFADGSARIEHALMVGSNSQRKVVVGENGATIGQMGISARKKIERALGRKVHLVLNVKVAEGRRAAFAESSESAGRGLVARP